MSEGLDRRLAALATAAELAEGRLDGARVERAVEVVRRAGERLGFGTEATVVALAGPTGAGKSTLFNALAGGELAKTSRRRPTTAAATAAIWGEPPHALLDWLGVHTRHAVEDSRREGLVLIDLPDFDSVEAGHRLEADRLIGLVDLLVWVVDPQKYADASLHDGYLRRLRAHADAMAVVINQVDLLAAPSVAECRSDLERLLDRDGLSAVPLLAVSAATGDGLAELDGLLDERVARRRAAITRLSGDVAAVAGELSSGCAAGGGAGVDREGRRRLLAALSEVSGAPVVVRAVASAHARRGALAAGWPLVRWVRSLRPDPLRRLRLEDQPREDVRTSLPAATAVQRSQADSAVRTLAARSAGELPDPWPSLVRSAATARQGELGERLDRAIAGAELPMRRPIWWTLAGAAQKLFALIAAAGALWLLAIVALGLIQLDDAVPLPELEGLPVPTLLLVGGLVLGLLFAWLARIANAAGARRRAARAAKTLQGRVEEVAEELVLGPIEKELDIRDRLCAALAAAAKRS